MGKFRNWNRNNTPFFKHENCLDVFFVIDKVRFDENGTHATIHGNWMIQGVFSFWPATERVRLNIRPEQYQKWYPYHPKGDLYV